MNCTWRRACRLLTRVAVSVGTAAGCVSCMGDDGDQRPIKPMVRLTNPAANDQDDMCVFPRTVGTDSAQESLIIVSDKKANALFSYKLDGTHKQTISVPTPGNIDIRTNVLVGDKKETVVVVNLRNVNRLAVFTLTGKSQCLTRIDSNQISTIENYGGALYHNKSSGELFFIATSKATGAAQYRVIDESGKIDGSLIRTFDVGMCEGAVVDDQSHSVYISDETKGVWKFDLSDAVTASPDTMPGKLVIRVGQHGLRGDVEGLAIASIDHKQCLILSDQGASRYRVYNIADNFNPIGSFSIVGAESTDGIAIAHGPLGKNYPGGIFLCHTDADDGKSVLASSWKSIARQLSKGE